MKYLIEIHQGIGDVIQITGLVETIYNEDPGADIGIIVNDEMRANIFRDDYRIKNIYLLDYHNKKHDIPHMIKKVRSYKYDYAFFSPISNHRYTQVLALLLGAKENYGEQFSELEKVSKHYHLVDRADTHIVKRNNNLLLATGKFNNVVDPRIIGLPTIIEEIEFGSRLVGLCIGTSKPSKTWALDRYLKVAEHFASIGCEIAFIGGKSEANLIPEELFIQHSSWHNFIDKLDLMGSAALTQKCCMVIGGDTGVMHMAAAVGTTTITLFSCSDPRLHAPYSDNSYIITHKVECQYCYKSGGYNNCPQYRCIEGIEADEVINVMEGLLNGSVSKKYKFKKPD